MTAAAAVRESPILFSAPMVRAVLDGTKTQTRRIVKPQPDFAEVPVFWSGDGHSGSGWYCMVEGYPEEGSVFYRCPHGVPGDRLWVRETVAIEHWTYEYGDKPPIPKDRPWKHRKVSHADGDDERWFFPHYRATDPPPDLCCERDNCRVCESGEPGPHWTPSIHMPRWASRITLAITDVRVQRLHDITTDDILAEGVRLPATDDGKALLRVSGEHPPSSFLVAWGKARSPSGDDLLRAEWAGLWSTINGRASWDANPWVWALTFKRVSTP